MLWFLGRYRAALEDLGRAVSVLQRAGHELGTARALDARGLAYLHVGSASRASADFAAAGHLYTQTSQDLEFAHTILNQAWAAFLSGDLPAALSLLDEAGPPRFRALNLPTPELSRDRCDETARRPG